MSSASGSPCPASEHTLCLFVTFLSESLNYSSIKVYLSAVRALHIEQGFQDPLSSCPRLERVVRGVKRTQGSSARQRLPVTNSVLLSVFSTLDVSSYDHCMFWAACNLAFFGFLRSSEFTVPSSTSFSEEFHLCVGDISVDSASAPASLRVHIKASKTDPFRQGCYIHIGRGKPPLCAVDSVLSYLSRRGDRPGPLFIMESGLPFSRSLLTSWLRRSLSSCGIGGNYSSHSFRIGAATVAAQNGIPDHLIQALGRWSSTAYLQYIRTPSEALAVAASQLAGNTSK